MFPVRDRSSGKESWYIPGIPRIKFASFKEALDWLLMFLGWLRDHEKFEEWSKQYKGNRPEEFSTLPFFEDTIEEFLQQHPSKDVYVESSSSEDVGGIGEMLF